MRNNEKKIENEMMEWRDESNGITYHRRMLKKMRKSGNDKRLFEEKRKKCSI